MSLTSKNGTVYDLYGPANAPVVALVHGLGLRRETWDGLLPALTDHYRVLNYDLFGHGESALPPKTPSLTVFSNQLRDLMDELQIDQAAIVGFSLGGMINRRFAMDNPDRALALGILNSPHERGEEAQRLVEERAADTSSGGPGANLDATIERWFTPEFRIGQPEFISKIRKWVLANDPVSYAQCRMVLANGVTELIRPPTPVAVPSLVMTCENDTGSTPAMSHAIAAEIDGAESIIVPHLQHMGLTERPELFADPLIDFLDRTLN